MSQGELREHRGYLADERKIAAYRAALAEVVRPGDVVLDLGAGTGLLGYLACESGAGSVIAVDRGDILGLARRIAADNGYDDRITHVRALSTAARIDTAVDVVVCDQIGGLVHDAGILTFFADARRRLLAPGGRLVPACFRIFLAPVTCDIGREAVDFWSSRPAGIDVRAARTVAANTEARYALTPDDLTALSAGAELAAFPSDHEDPIGGESSFVVATAGRFDGFVGWFEAAMSPSVTITNDPWAEDRIDRWCNFYPADEAVDVRPGDRVAVRLDVRPRLGVVSWTIDLEPSGGERRRFRHSTFRGSFLTAETVDAFARGTPVPRSDRLDAVRDVLDLVDGVRTQAAIVDALSDRIGTTFVSSAEVEAFVRDVASFAR
jgi:SAM-dependent methyltransferase